MNTDLRSIYEQYVLYFREFCEDFDRQFGPIAAEKFRAPLLAFDDFTVIWNRWTNQGTHVEWQARFQKGYVRHAAEFEERIKSVLTRTQTGSRPAMVADAA